jgi:radical SAM superfamily enzyme YgiQ (UPF0313 family)
MNTPGVSDILFINPRHPYNHYFTQPELVRLMGKKNSLGPLSLALLAAHTPDTYSKTVWDEDVSLIDSQRSFAKLVGIKVVTPASPRAYKLADEFRAAGSKVVLGGPHITVTTTAEALSHADSVVVGEAEGVWPGLLGDFERGEMRKVYSPEKLIPYKKALMPRWDLFDAGVYLSLPVQASRGCPFNCEFCNVSTNYGRTVRVRDVDNVVEEVASLPNKRVFFVDDNISIQRKFARELMHGLKGAGITWFCQASIDIADDAALLGAMAEAGCENILVGFESLNSANLATVEKFHNLRKDYGEAIKKINAAGIHVLATFMFGLENDTLEDFERLRRFSIDAPLPFVSLSFVAAAPGTRLEERVKKENLLYPIPANINGGLYPSLKHPSIGPVAQYNAFVDALQKQYAFDTVYEKAKALFGSGHFSRAKKDGEVTFLDKVLFIALMLRAFVFTRDKWRRRLFTYLLSLIPSKTVAPERAFIFLMTMHAYSLSVKKIAREKEESLAIIRSYTGDMQGAAG